MKKILFLFFLYYSLTGFGQVSNLTGKVSVKGNGFPIKNAYLLYEDKLDSTDNIGLFKIENIPFGTYEFTVWAPGYKMIKDEIVNIDSTQEKKEFMLEKLGNESLAMYKIVGFVYNINNMVPISHASIGLTPIEIDDTEYDLNEIQQIIDFGGFPADYATKLKMLLSYGSIQVSSGKDGFYSFDGLPKGRYLVDCKKDLYNPFQILTGIENQSSLINFLLKAIPGKIEGKVERYIISKDGENKDSVFAMDAVVEIEGLDSIMTYNSKEENIVYGPFESKVDSQGNYSIDDLTPGRYNVYSWTPGYQRDSASIMVASNQTVNHDIKLDYEGANLAIELFCSDYIKEEDFLPLEETTVKISGQVGRDSTEIRITKKTDKFGKIVLTDLPPGNYNINVQSREILDGEEVIAKFPSREISLQLGAKLDTTLKIDLLPVKGTILGHISTRDSLELTPPPIVPSYDSFPAPGSLNYTAYLDSGFIRADLMDAKVELCKSDFLGYTLSNIESFCDTTDEHGNFSIHVPPGEYVFKIVKEGYNEKRIDVTIVPDFFNRIWNVQTDTIDFEAKISSDGESFTDDLIKPDWDYVYGAVLRDLTSVNPMEGFKVELKMNPTYQALSNKKGLFLMTKIPKGIYNSEISHTSYQLIPPVFQETVDVKGLGLIVQPVIIPDLVTAELKVKVVQNGNQIMSNIRLAQTTTWGRTKHITVPGNDIIDVPVSEQFDIILAHGQYFNIGQWKGVAKDITVNLDQNGKPTNNDFTLIQNISLKGFLNDRVSGIALDSATVILIYKDEHGDEKRDTTYTNSNGEYKFDNVISENATPLSAKVEFEYDIIKHPEMRFYSPKSTYIQIEPGINRFDEVLEKDRGELDGLVKEKEGDENLEGVYIIVPNPQNKNTTNNNGEFQHVLVKVPSVKRSDENPKVTVRFRKTGYFPVKKDDVSVKKGDTTPLGTIFTQRFPKPFIENFKIISKTDNTEIHGHVLKGLKKGEATKAILQVETKRLHPVADSCKLLLTENESDFRFDNWPEWLEKNDRIKSVKITIKLESDSISEFDLIKTGKYWEKEIDLADFPLTNSFDIEKVLHFIIKVQTEQNIKKEKVYKNIDSDVKIWISKPPAMMNFISSTYLGYFPNINVSGELKPPKKQSISFSFGTFSNYDIEQKTVGDHRSLLYDMNAEVSMGAGTGLKNPWLEIIGSIGINSSLSFGSRVEPLFGNTGVRSYGDFTLGTQAAGESIMKAEKTKFKFLKIAGGIKPTAEFLYKYGFEDSYYLPTSTGTFPSPNTLETQTLNFKTAVGVSASVAFPPLKVLELTGTEITLSVGSGIELSKSVKIDRNYFPIVRIPLLSLPNTDTISITPSGTLGLEASVLFVASASLSGTLSAKTEWEKEIGKTLEMKKLTLGGKVEYNLTTLFVGKSGTLAEGTIFEWEKGTESTAFVRPLKDSIIIRRNWNRPNYSLLNWIDGQSHGILLNNGYPFMKAELATDTLGNTIIVYNEDKLDEDLPLSVKPKVSYFNSMNHSFSVPENLDGTSALFSCATYIEQNEPISIWSSITDAKSSLDVLTGLNKTELFYSTKNLKSNQWDAPVRLTNDNNCELSPVISSNNNGEMMLIWIKDFDGNIFTLDDNKLYFSQWQNDSFSTPKSISDDVAINSVPSLDFLNNKAALVYSLDADHNFQTTNDRTIHYKEFYQNDWKESEIVTSNYGNYRSPEVTILPDNKSVLSWIKDGIVMDSVLFTEKGTGFTEIVDSAKVINDIKMVSTPDSLLIFVWTTVENGSTYLWMKRKWMNSGWGENELLDNASNKIFNDLALKYDKMTEKFLILYSSMDSVNAPTKDLLFITKSRYKTFSDYYIIPNTFELNQNQPNPFNFRTKISYILPESARVKLSIYNIHGEEIKTLVNEFQNEGYQSINWNARNEKGQIVPTGLYVYTLTLNNRNKLSKKMIFRNPNN